MSDTESQNGEAVADLSNSDVVTKYKAAAEICNKALVAVIAAAKDGAKVVELCQLGDDTITKECQGIFKSKNLEKGISFPTCVSVNSVIGHFSPMSDDATTLKEGDVVKIDLGCHIDGFIATQAQTVVVQADSSAAVTGRAADVIQAARTAFEAALRLIRPGKKISDVAGPLNKIAEAYGCSMVEGVMSHEIKQFVIDGTKCILNKPSAEQKVEDADFEENEVYAVDIVVSTGEGKSRVKDEKETTVYKRALENEYQLRVKSARAVYSMIKNQHPYMPFTQRAIFANAGDLKQSEVRLGLTECIRSGMLHPYPVLHEAGPELVAQIKGTVLLMPNGSDVVTKVDVATKVETDKKVEDPEIQALLATSIKSKKKAKKNKTKKEGEEKADA